MHMELREMTQDRGKNGLSAPEPLSFIEALLVPVSGQWSGE